MSRTLRALLVLAVMTVPVGVALSALGASDEEPLDIRPPLDHGRERILTLLTAKERALERREATVAAREADLKAAEEQVQARLVELEALREAIRKDLRQLDEQREAEVRGLVRMFESMRAGEAAAVLVNTEDDVALEVLARMNKAKAGRTLAKMEPRKAARLAELLGRPALHAEVP